MEDSGIDSDCKTGLLGTHRPYAPIPDHDEEELSNEGKVTDVLEHSNYSTSDNEINAVCYKGPFKPPKIKSSVLQKHIEKQMLQTRKLRQKQQHLEGMPKKLIPRSRLKVPKSQAPLVMKADSHPLVSWESESDDEIDYHPISKSGAKEITEQLIKDGYNLDITPDDEDLDLIPPKPLPPNRCICCSMNCMCIIQ